MHIRDLTGKTIGILGFGREGQAMLKALEQYAPDAVVTILDQNPTLTHQDYPVITGPRYLDRLDQFDVLIKSPGIPLSSKLTTHSAKLTTPTQIFFDTIQDTGAVVIGVTGSKGKSTTASLIHFILQSDSRSPKSSVRSFLVGNIGDPAIAHLAEAKPGVVFVMEMSSYQLQDLSVSPPIAVVTAFFPEHLDYHGSLEAYREAKTHIACFQEEGDCVFFAADSAGARAIAAEGKGEKIPFTQKDAPVQIHETKLLGNHNLSNIAAAYLVSQKLGVPRDAAVTAIRSFTPLSHRLQSFGVRQGIEWVDDSISTTPESAIAALDALGERVTTVLLGGQDRGYDFTPLAQRLKDSSVHTVILMGESGKRIQEALEKANVQLEIVEAGTMQEAVVHAKQIRKLQIANREIAHAPIVLLSPASPSYGMFKNFEERGDAFKQAIG